MDNSLRPLWYLRDNRHGCLHIVYVFDAMGDRVKSLLILLITSVCFAQVIVHPFIKKNGKLVNGYIRSRPVKRH